MSNLVVVYSPGWSGNSFFANSPTLITVASTSTCDPGLQLAKVPRGVASLVDASAAGVVVEPVVWRSAADGVEEALLRPRPGHCTSSFARSARGDTCAPVLLTVSTVTLHAGFSCLAHCGSSCRAASATTFAVAVALIRFGCGGDSNSVLELAFFKAAGDPALFRCHVWSLLHERLGDEVTEVSLCLRSLGGREAALD